LPRLEALSIWAMEKVKSSKRSSRPRNVNLGSCIRMDADAAFKEARAMKADALEIKI